MDALTYSRVNIRDYEHSSRRFGPRKDPTID